MDAPREGVAWTEVMTTSKRAKPLTKVFSAAC